MIEPENRCPLFLITLRPGSLVAGLVAAQLETLPAATIFAYTAIFAGATGVLGLLVSPSVSKMMGHVS